MQFSHLVSVSDQVAATRSRLEKRAALSQCLRQAAAAEVRLVVNYLTGTLPQGRIGLGFAISRDLAGGEPASPVTPHERHSNPSKTATRLLTASPVPAAKARKPSAKSNSARFSRAPPPRS